MGFDISGAASGAATGAAIGGPIGAVAGGIIGGTGRFGLLGPKVGGDGGDGGGIAGVSTVVKLSKEGEALKTKLFDVIRTRKFPSKLSSQLIGNALKIEGQKRQVREKALTVTGPSPDVIRSNIGQVIGTGIGGVAEAGAGPRAVFGEQRGFERERFANLQNIINIERQVPAFVQQAEFINQLLAQQGEAERGAALGALSQIGGDVLSQLNFGDIFETVAAFGSVQSAAPAPGGGAGFTTPTRFGGFIT